MGINFWDCIAQPRREIDKVWEIVWERGTLKIHAIHPRLYLVNFDLENIVVRPFLFTKLGLFTLSGLVKEWDIKKGAGNYSLNQVFH